MGEGRCLSPHWISSPPSPGARPQEMSHQSRKGNSRRPNKRLFAKMWAGVGKSWARHGGGVPTLGWKRGGQGERGPETQPERVGCRRSGAPGVEGNRQPQGALDLTLLQGPQRFPFGQIHPEGRERLWMAGVSLRAESRGGRRRAVGRQKELAHRADSFLSAA